MSKKLLPLLWLSLVILAWCTTKDISSDIIIQTWEAVVTTWSIENNTGIVITTWGEKTIYDDYPSVWSLDVIFFGKQRKQWDQWLYINDISWKWMYHDNRDWIYVGTMGLQSVDVKYGYMSWILFIEPTGTESVISFPVDGKTYISYRPQLENPNYTGTGVMQVQDKRKNYQVCRDGYSMEQEEVVYDRDRYNALVEKNPIRCFGEDKTYIYGRREYKQSEQWGYELMRVKK